LIRGEWKVCLRLKSRSRADVVERNQGIRESEIRRERGQNYLGCVDGEAALKMIIPRYRGFSAQLAWDGVSHGGFRGFKEIGMSKYPESNRFTG